MRQVRLWGAFLLFTLIILTHNETEAAKKSRFYYEKKGDIVWEVPTKEEKIIALTFDDGPDPRYTPVILNLLDEYEAKATFFVVGSRIDRYPRIAKRQVKEGHELANHTYSHLQVQGQSVQRIEEEIKRAGTAIEEITGQPSYLFRPPTGYYDDNVVNAAKSQGYTVVMWSWHQDTFDWRNPGVGRIVNQVLNNARSGDIVLFHDTGGNRRQTIEALKQILPELEKRGYKFVTISDLLKHHPNYKSLYPL
ncbi:polysaccharide deacetylase family protein [Metabacillus iocasae]|uniref:Polysaccharide deacetylase family sporulation protein PdaB n=1 Tax=Priestia iocasae TaxID=2291674 RepID=A0ABS2QRG6_9BACI|nr:polysaccharide deacetylase family protein [Metabacillus iocasae]MBM7702043.1 polysaccharide deacetylase family sporulation protein PdaB [Metabacillus iocasae]